jgi:predicted component of type VI protein secretion system
MLQPSLKLTILASHGKALADGPCASFDASGGSIGAAADSTLRLPDDAGVAERHALIRAQYGAWCLVNISGQAALTVNGKALAAGQQTRLQSGDIVNLGSYVLQAAETLPPAWDFQMQRSAGAPSQEPDLPRPDRAGDLARLATPPLEPLAFGRLHGLPASELPSAGLDGLLDTPVDPLALFGAPGQGWRNAAETPSSDLFADLAGGRVTNGFEATPSEGVHGFAVRDDAPAHSAPLRLKIANAQMPAVGAASASSSPSPSPMNTTAAPAVTAKATGQPEFAASAPTTARAAEATVPQYGEHSQVKAAFRHGAPVKLTCANTPMRVHDPAAQQVPQGPQPDHENTSIAALSALSALSEAFLDGAGVPPGRHIEAGFTPEFMRALGAIARALRAQ